MSSDREKFEVKFAAKLWEAQRFCRFLSSAEGRQAVRDLYRAWAISADLLARVVGAGREMEDDHN